MNLQPVKTYWAVSTVTVTNRKHDVPGHTLCLLYIIQPPMHCRPTTVYSTTVEGHKSMESTCPQCASSRRWVRPEHFVDITSNMFSPEATGEAASCVPYPALTWFLTDHHRLIAWLAADLLWCRVVYHTVWREVQGHKGHWCSTIPLPEQLGGNWHCPARSHWWEWDSHLAFDPAGQIQYLLVGAGCHTARV